MGFSLLGGTAPFESWRVVSAGDPDSERRDLHHLAQANTLDDFKNLLFAVHSYNKALLAGYAQGGADFANYMAVAMLTRGGSLLATSIPSLTAQLNIMFASGNVFGFVKDIAARSPAISPVVNLIADIGTEKFLDMMMGATVGQSLTRSTTEANFASRATTFFNAYGTTLQTIGAQMLPTSAAALAALARVDTAEGASTRAALLALSVVRVDVSVATVAQVRLYNATTGQGNITAQWIDDRAAFTAAHYQKLQGLGGNVPGSQNIRYFDAASGTEVLVGSGARSLPSNEHQYTFEEAA